MKKILIASPLIVVFCFTAFLCFHRSSPPVPHGIAASWSVNERTIAKLQDKLKQEPNSAEWNTALGHAYLQKARETGDPSYYSKAEQLFDRALSSKRNYVEALAGKASLEMSRHEFQAARKFAEQAIRLNPDIAMTYGVLADALVELGDYDAAIRTLDKMVRLKPNLSSYSRISYIRELTGDTEGAIQAMQMAVDSGAPNAENTAWCMVQLGNLHLNSGRLAEANTLYRSALARFPNYVHAFAGLARLAVAQKDFIAAMHFYQQAIDGVPLPEFLTGLGDVYILLGKPAEAEQQFALVRTIEKLYRANGVNMDLEMVLFAVDHGGSTQEAVKTIGEEWNRRKSVKVADAYAWTLYRAGRVEEARRMMKQALRLGSKDPLFLTHAAAIGSAA